MVGHYELEDRRNSGEATGKEMAAMLSPRLNRCCKKVDEVAQLTAKQCMHTGELRCGGCGPKQRRSAWRRRGRLCGVARERERAREQRTRTIIRHGGLEAPLGLTWGLGAGVRSPHGGHSLAPVGLDGQPEMAIRPR
jgi:hypothetical protein